MSSSVIARRQNERPEVVTCRSTPDWRDDRRQSTIGNQLAVEFGLASFGELSAMNAAPRNRVLSVALGLTLIAVSMSIDADHHDG